MKRILYAFIFLLFTAGAFAQDDEGGNGEKIQERMREFIQKRLDLSKGEADRFTPVFLDYFKELRQTNQQFRSDPLIKQQKIVDLRLRYRDQFKNIMGEKRSNDVFKYERDFLEEAKRLRQERMQGQGIKNKPLNKRFDRPLP